MLFNSAALAAGLMATSVLASPVEKRCFGSEVVIYARGTSPQFTGTAKPYGDSTDAALASIASEALPTASVMALPYPASGKKDTSDYRPSWTIGIDNLQSMIKDVVDNSCSTTKIILLGYSQGASVITGAVGGGMGRAPLSGKYLAAIAAGVPIADPSYVAHLSPLDDLAENQDVNGSFQQNGVQQFINTNKPSSWRSLCSKGDAFCANAGLPDNGIHEGAQKTWHPTAVKFLQDLKL